MTDNNDSFNGMKMKHETYSRKDIEELLKNYNHYLEKPSGSKEERDRHSTEFEEAVIGASIDIRDFSTGLLSVEDDAISDMRKYIDTFGKEYIKGKYVFTDEAQKALERLDNMEKEIRLKKEQTKETTQKNNEHSDKKENKEMGISLQEAAALMKKKPKDRTLAEYLLLNKSIENNPKLSPQQQKKAMEKLTSQARLRMSDPKNVKDEELASVDAFIEAFGYDKKHALNKQARSFGNAMKKRMDQKEKDKVKSKETLRPENKTKNNKKKKRGFFGWFKEKTANVAKWLNRHKPMLVIGVIVGSSLFGARGHGQIKSDSQQKQDFAKEIALSKHSRTTEDIVKTITLPEVVITPHKTDLGVLKQYAKRIGFQDNLTSEESAKRAAKDLKSFKHLDEEFKAQFAGEHDEEKLAKLGVVRGDQKKLRPAIDALINGEKVEAGILEDIVARTRLVTDDYGANKDYAQQNGKQTLDMSVYMLQKIADKSHG